MTERQPEDKRSPQRVVRGFQRRMRTLPRWECVNATYSIRCSLLLERREDLTQEPAGGIVREALHYHDGRRDALHFYTIMPDHLHAVIEPLPREGGIIPLPEITHGLKSFTAHRINALAGVRGGLWLSESYSRIIRCSEEYWDWYNYIWLNPWRAVRGEDPHNWPWWWERSGGE